MPPNGTTNVLNVFQVLVDSSELKHCSCRWREGYTVVSSLDTVRILAEVSRARDDVDTRYSASDAASHSARVFPVIRRFTLIFFLRRRPTDIPCVPSRVYTSDTYVLYYNNRTVALYHYVNAIAAAARTVLPYCRFPPPHVAGLSARARALSHSFA